MILKLGFIFILFFSCNAINSQKCPAVNYHLDTIITEKNKPLLPFSYRQLIIPTAGIFYGIAGLKIPSLRLLNKEIREEVNEHIDNKFSVDDFMQYAPSVSAIGLELIGIKGKNSIKERSLVLLTSYILMITVVTSLKNTTNVERPDKTGHKSFPSGHTANAFVGAELLWQEYREQSIWYGIAGYAIACGTGAFRVINNRHWLTDVSMGAGIGILSTKLAYWMYPSLNKVLFHCKPGSNTLRLEPLINTNQYGLCLHMGF
ncbi:MAG TPA: phosphatase PAP2 family protein [Saprospiraceae bacterium]|nr:phosphatase PAP2 family protein [Saprospiraceae bacterium]